LSHSVSWYYLFPAPGSTRENRRQIKKGGFATKGEATAAEAARRLEIANEAEETPGATPKTLGAVIREWLKDRGPILSPKTATRYGELAEYLSPEVAALPVAEVTPLHLHREWKRLNESGGHHRKTQTARPLSAKTVRHIAGVVSSAYRWAILFGLAPTNPVTHSSLPQGTKRAGIALSPSQQQLVIEAAGGPWCLGVYLESCAGLGARRGEVLALRWSDIDGDYAIIGRSLCQADGELYFKGTKTGRTRRIEIPARTLQALEAHRTAQSEYRSQFGSSYRTDLDLIFAAPDGEPLKPDSVSSSVSLLCHRLKLPKGASLHTLRHSHGSQLIADGVPIPEVSARLGHSNPNVTMGIYAHVIPGQGDAAKRWEQIQGSGVEPYPVCGVEPKIGSANGSRTRI
jgi:integrase